MSFTVSVSDPQKQGEGLQAYVSYKVSTSVRSESLLFTAVIAMLDVHINALLTDILVLSALSACSFPSA